MESKHSNCTRIARELHSIVSESIHGPERGLGVVRAHFRPGGVKAYAAGMDGVLFLPAMRGKLTQSSPTRKDARRVAERRGYLRHHNNHGHRPCEWSAGVAF